MSFFFNPLYNVKFEEAIPKIGLARMDITQDRLFVNFGWADD
jgi:hypothetical protein